MVQQRACSRENNRKECNCSYEPCSRKGLCCECLSYHWSSREMPACFFPNDAEKTFDRSLDHFIRLWDQKSGK